jgi:hypothetical protein
MAKETIWSIEISNWVDDEDSATFEELWTGSTYWGGFASVESAEHALVDCAMEIAGDDGTIDVYKNRVAAIITRDGKQCIVSIQAGPKDTCDISGRLISELADEDRKLAAK